MQAHIMLRHLLVQRRVAFHCQSRGRSGAGRKFREEINDAVGCTHSGVTPFATGFLDEIAAASTVIVLHRAFVSNLLPLCFLDGT